MSTIGPPAELTAYLRSQLSALRGVTAVSPNGSQAAQSTSQGTGKSPASESPARATTTAAPEAQEDLAAAIARRVATIDKADPDRRRKAFRVFLESLLLDEWGSQLINDPGFYQLVDNVQAQMETRPDLRKLMDEAASKLLAT